jgi:hypothetical protein
MKLRSLTLATVLVACATIVPAQTPRPSEHVKKDITRHRAMAAAHEAAARCLESGKSEDSCLKELQMACKGLAIGKYCGMKHEH